MRYIVVNERTPKGLPRFCSLCLRAIENSYTRDLYLRSLYCTPTCYEVHVFEAMVVIGALDAPMKFIPYEKGGLR